MVCQCGFLISTRWKWDQQMQLEIEYIIILLSKDLITGWPRDISLKPLST